MTAGVHRILYIATELLLFERICLNIVPDLCPPACPSVCLLFWFGDYSDETAIMMPTPLLDRDSWRTTCGLLASLWSVDTL